MKHLLVCVVCLAGVWGIMMTGAGCDPTPSPDGGTPDTKPALQATMSSIEANIFEQSCSFSSCHGGGAGELTLSPGMSYNNLVNKASHNEPSKQLVVPGKPEESVLYNVLKGAVGSIRRMPTGSPIKEEKIKVIFDWIKNGAKND